MHLWWVRSMSQQSKWHLLSEYMHSLIGVVVLPSCWLSYLASSHFFHSECGLHHKSRQIPRVLYLFQTAASTDVSRHYSLVHTDHLDGSYFIEDCPRQAIKMGEDTDCVPTSSRQQCGFHCYICTVSLDDRFLSTQRRRSNSDAILERVYTFLVCELLAQNI